MPGVRPLRRAHGSGRHVHGGRPVATVAVDALGADLGAAEVAAGAGSAATRGTSCLVFGPKDELTDALGRNGPAAVEIVDAPVYISNDEEPAHAVRAKPEASIVQGARAVSDGRAQALVTAGSTGAALVAALVHVKRVRGVYRPALAVLVPVPGRPVLLLDVGANVEVRPEHLVQFAFMGAAFSEHLLGVERPRVGLLSVGEEPGKGTATVVAAHERLSALAGPPFRFVGNVEGGGVTAGEADVVVTDGFTGNVALKLLEGTTKTLVGAIREAIHGGTVSKLGGLLIRSRMGELRERLDPETVGGAYLLGLRGLVVVCHGSSTRRAIDSAIVLAERGVNQGIVERMAAALEVAGVARSSPSAASVTADTVPERS